MKSMRWFRVLLWEVCLCFIILWINVERRYHDFMVSFLVIDPAQIRKLPQHLAIVLDLPLQLDDRSFVMKRIGELVYFAQKVSLSQAITLYDAFGHCKALMHETPTKLKFKFNCVDLQNSNDLLGEPECILVFSNNQQNLFGFPASMLRIAELHFIHCDPTNWTPALIENALYQYSNSSQRFGC